ncbi:MAG: TfoX/Sxy family protein [Oscillospiraceae bacterium]
MASSLDYVQYVCDQMSGAGDVTYKKMFGEYTIYCNSKVLGLICDNQVFIKPTTAGETLIPNATKDSPYDGAKLHIVLEDLDDRDFITGFVIATCEELPFPKPRKNKIRDCKLL